MKTIRFFLLIGLFALVGCNINVPVEVSAPEKIKYGSFTDQRDGSEYKTITLGNQTWMAENLRYMPQVHSYRDMSRYESRYYVYSYDGTDVNAAKKYVLDSNDSRYNSLGDYKSESIYSTFGVLYNETAAATASPDGWRLPTMSDFEELWRYLKDKYPGEYVWAKSALLDIRSRSMQWALPTYGGDYPYIYSSGFNAMPAGAIYGYHRNSYAPYEGSCEELGNRTYYWMINPYKSNNQNNYCFALVPFLGNEINIYYSETEDYEAYSIRCIKK